MLKVLSAMLILLMTGFMLHAQTSQEAQKKEKQEQEMQIKELEMQLKKQQMEWEMQMKKQQMEQEKKTAELARAYEAEARSTGRARERSFVYTSPSGSDEGAYFIQSFGQESQSQLTLRNSFNGETVNSSGEFEVDENTTQFRLTANGLFLVSAVLMIVISCYLLMRNYQFPKQDFESSIKYITERKGQTDEIRTLGRAAAPYNKYYQLDWPAIESEEELRVLNDGATDIWLVMIFPKRTTRKYDGIMSYVNKNYSLTKSFRGTLGDGNILVFKSKP